MFNSWQSSAPLPRPSFLHEFDFESIYLYRTLVPKALVRSLACYHATEALGALGCDEAPCTDIDLSISKKVVFEGFYNPWHLHTNTL